VTASWSVASAPPGRQALPYQRRRTPDQPAHSQHKSISHYASMASPRRFPFDDEDRPSGSVRPLSHADLQAILAHLDEDPMSSWLAPAPIGRWWQCGSGPVWAGRAGRPSEMAAGSGGRVGRLDPDQALAGRRRPRQGLAAWGGGGAANCSAAGSLAATRRRWWSDRPGPNACAWTGHRAFSSRCAAAEQGGCDLKTPDPDLKTQDRAGCRCRRGRSPVG
jgi:hypothetical protein